MLEGRAEEKDPHHETWRSVSFGASAAEGRILVIMYACLTYVPGVISPFFPFLVSLLLQLSHPCEFLYAKPIRMLTGFQSFCSPRSVGHRTRPGQKNMTDWEVLKQLLPQPQWRCGGACLLLGCGWGCCRYWRKPLRLETHVEALRLWWHDLDSRQITKKLPAVFRVCKCSQSRGVPLLDPHICACESDR